MLGEQSACVHVSEEMASFTREGKAKEAKRGKYLALLSRSSTSSKSLLVFPAGGIPLPSRPSYKPAPLLTVPTRPESRLGHVTSRAPCLSVSQ